ncbi:MAG TPA: phytanoyl-CoA dioxygenase family protein [Roseiflexaceae bacterium]|nr:phytanoyl-CoA dioxygenase family protein [Roseiflexaceae bacterium]
MSIDSAIVPRLTALGQEIDTSPDQFGALESSIHLADDPAALRDRMAAEGYVYLPGYLDRDEVLAARQEIAQRLAAAGHTAPGTPPGELIARDALDIAFLPDLALDNPPLDRLLYSGRMIAFFTGFLGGQVRHYDFTWLRTVAPGRGTAPHMDIVFMGRGTTNLCTAWTPLGDVPLEMGGLMILERSHQHERLNNGYGRKDVDAYCVNHVGEGYTKMGGGGNIALGGWLSKNPVKLRRNLGGRWLTSNFRAGDLLVFSMFTVHTSLDNHSDRIRISSDTRYQLASEPVDERWIGEHPPAHGPSIKKGMIC